MRSMVAFLLGRSTYVSRRHCTGTQHNTHHTARFQFRFREFRGAGGAISVQGGGGTKPKSCPPKFILQFPHHGLAYLRGVDFLI